MNPGLFAIVRGVTALAVTASTAIAQLQFKELPKHHLSTYMDRTLALAVGDVDVDGFPDLVVGNAFEQNRLHLNDGTGTFVDVTAQRMPTEGDNTSALAIGDVDGDGDDDLVFGNLPLLTSGGQNRLFINDGTGTFTDETAARLPVLVDFTFAVVLGDVDGDRDLDLIFGNLPQSRLYMNDGTGTFTDVTATHLPNRFHDTSALALGDVDGDGDSDLVLANTLRAGPIDRQNRLYLNDGRGSFSDATMTHMPVDNHLTSAVALGDLDGDGDADIVFGNSIGGSGVSIQNCLYLNDGTGRFTDVTSGRLPADSDHTVAIAIADVDGDGDADLVLGNHNPFTSSGRQNRLYRNDGTATFADATSFLPSDADDSVALVLSDVDVAVVPDLVVGNDGEQNRLYLNLLRQLDSPIAVRIGGQYRLDAYARRGPSRAVDLVFPFVATATARIPLPPFGTVFLDPAQTVALPPFVVPQPAGVNSVSFAVPNSPSLVRVFVYAQALLVQSPTLIHLTNWTSDQIRQ